jgi:hypothetical protein
MKKIFAILLILVFPGCISSQFSDEGEDFISNEDKIDYIREVSTAYNVGYSDCVVEARASFQKGIDTGEIVVQDSDM